MDGKQPLIKLKGISTGLAGKFAALGVNTLEQLTEFYPRRYDDFSKVMPIAKILPGPVTIKASIKQVSSRYVRRGLHITEAVASDDSGSVRLLWFNQPYRKTGLRTSQDYFISGQFELNRQRMSIMNPAAELASNFGLNTARIVPIYRETKGLKSSQIRKIVQQALNISEPAETLPAWLLNTQNLISRAQAVRSVHFPGSHTDLAAANRRLGFEEVFELTLAALLNKREISREKALKINFNRQLAVNFVSHLPFKLTDAQRQVVWQIYQDMQKAQPMNRLVEGDVGAGKTVVAAMAAVMVMSQGYQVALMAPTELLARQHFSTIRGLLEPLGLMDQLGLLIGSLNDRQKSACRRRLSTGDLRLVVGTHALITEKVDMHKLGLIIIDEQHRFGVDQRKTLQAKAGHMPHVLNLTATPIPRSLALTLYGELDISIIDAKPVGRQPIITRICSPNSRAALYQEIGRELDRHHQMFVVCPLISDSSTLDKASSAESVYKQLSQGPFKNRAIGLLHGRLKADEKEAVMRRFIERELDILVATTVIEVGVDVPNASIMLIESAERFGLAQLHQLRGRVGRGSAQGYCYLMMSDSQAPSRRLRALEQSDDGFKLAEMDLEIRGPGAIYGTAQHGALDLRIAKLSDIKLIAAARLGARDFIERGENLLEYRHLAERVQRLRAVTNLN